MAAATFIVALSAVLFKYFAVEDSFWGTTFWTFVGEGFFGAGILLVPGHYQQFGRLFQPNPGAVIGINAANELIDLGGGLGVRYASLLAPVALVSAVSSTTTLFVFALGETFLTSTAGEVRPIVPIGGIIDLTAPSSDAVWCWLTRHHMSSLSGVAEGHR